MLPLLTANDWTYEAAAHLLNRAAFGGTAEEIEQLYAEGAETAVDRLLNPPEDPAQVQHQSWTVRHDMLERRNELRALKGRPQEQMAKRKEMRQEQHAELRDLRTWWITRMRNSPAPLAEKMTLFWHGHFATSAQKVKTAYPMWRQNELFREHSLGHFPTLLKAVSRDPAMMVYLDLQQSKKDHPNENWSREVMELFTLGIGNYTEEDVKESARAFTGYRIDPRRQVFRYIAFQHDQTPKTFLGHTGNFTGDGILDAIVAQPACPQFIGRKLWRFFVEDDPSPETVKTVGDLLRHHDFQVKPTLREVFLSRDFYSDRVRRTQIKSPVQFLVQSCKLLSTDLPPSQAIDGALRSMGQMLFAPPNVKGWDGGKAWISTATLLFRYNFANYLLNGTGGQPEAPAALQREPIDVAQIAPEDQRGKPESLIAELGHRLFQAPVASKQSETLLAYLKAKDGKMTDETLRHLLHLMMSTPQFQLT